MQVNRWWVVAGLLLSLACGGGDGGGGVDGGGLDAATDTGSADTGAGDGGPDDGGGGDGATGDAGRDATMPPEDGGSGGDDAGGATDAGGLPDGSAGSCAGDECPDYAAVLAAAPRGATSLDNCVVQLHQTDCCGARRAYGVNHAARESLCPAETACVASYDTTASCDDAAVTTDTGETTTDMGDVRIRIVDPTPCGFDASVTCYTCETFVCTGGACLAEPGIAGGCG